MMSSERRSKLRRSTIDRNPSKPENKRRSTTNDTQTLDETLDIAIKEWAFSRNFQLPLSPTQVVNVLITNIAGDTVATGYNKIIADGESIWLEIPRERLNLGKFTVRQQTASRNFYTFFGVTTHFQKQSETGLSPRRHKLAVKVKRNSPSCRLEVGKWYIHAHQVKIYVQARGRNIPRRLRTNQLVNILKTVFGRAYSPRIKSRPPTQDTENHYPKPNRVSKKEQHKTATPLYTPNAIFKSGNPLPLQAPPPWANPAYYTGQVPNNLTQLSG